MGAATCDFAQQSVKIIHRALCKRARERNDRRPFTFKDAAAPADSLIDNARSQTPSTFICIHFLWCADHHLVIIVAEACALMTGAYTQSHSVGQS
jgi:hypothetical protein